MNEGRIAAWLLCMQMLHAGAVAAQDARADRPWQASISVGGGWNDNPALIGSAITFGTPASAVPFITRRGAYFGRFAFDGSYDLIRGREQLLTVGYGLHGDQYENDAKEVNQQVHNLWAGYQRRLAPNFAVSFQVADEYVRIGGSSFSNAVMLEPSAYWRFASWGALELDYKRGYFDMRIPVLAPGTDRDGTFDDVGARFFFDVPDTELKLRAGFRHRSNDTDKSTGGLFDYRANTAAFGITHPLPLGVLADLGFERRRYHYQGLGPALGVGRADTIDFATLLLTRPLSQRMRLYLRYDYIDADSNAALFHFRQRVIGAGLVWNF